MAESIVQYIVLRTDLKWQLGAIAAQACHASVAAIHLFSEDQETQKYLDNLDSMHKVVLEAKDELSLTQLSKSLEEAGVPHKLWIEQPENIPAKDELSLTQLSKSLEEAGVPHKLWIEQPENIPVCLATKPCTKENIQGYFKHLKLCRNKVS